MHKALTVTMTVTMTKKNKIQIRSLRNKHGQDFSIANGKLFLLFTNTISTFARAEKDHTVFVKLVDAIDNNFLDIDRKKTLNFFGQYQTKMATLIRESYSENATIYLLGGTEEGRVMRFLCIFRCFFFSHTIKLGQKCKLQKNTIEIFY